MRFIFTVLLCSTSWVWAQEQALVFRVKQLPLAKTIGKVTVQQCKDRPQAFSELKDFNMKCLIVKKDQEQWKFFTLFDKEQEVATFKGLLGKEESLKNSVTLRFRNQQIEVEF